MYRSFSLLLLALALLSLTATSWASIIYVSGDQTGTWSADTVIVTNQVIVPPGQSLTILPGVEVLFSVYCKLIVDNGATLRAVGSLADSIRFDVLPPDIAWHGIRFLSASDSSRLEYCHLTNGWASGSFPDNKGGAIYCSNSSPSISSNSISGNSTTSSGGGIYCEFSSPSIIGNTISGNSASSGGGICCGGGSPIISGNTISGNSGGLDAGGGIYCEHSSPMISGNTISGNSAAFGGGICCWSSSPPLINCILWGNAPDQIYGTPIVTYSDIQDGWTGTGNINAYPAFVDTAQHDYRLQWGSPCIDTGDPNPIYNDPDLTRADMGAWYYDQSLPVRILLTPYNMPIQIPASGGSFQFALRVTNSDNIVHATTAWCNVTLPSGAIVGPLLGPVTVPLGAGQTLSRLRTQVVPANAPAGIYHYNAYAVAAGDTSEDSFTFVKLGVGDCGVKPPLCGGLGIGGWTNTGEEFGELQGVQLNAPTPPMTSDLCVTVSPNPANPKTAISYKLQAPSRVSLRIYDTAGRLVTTLVDGWRDAGEQQVTFDGSALTSGMYLYRLEAGGATAIGKMVLMK